MRPGLALALAATLSFAASGCDWAFFHFMNSLPLHGDPKKNPEVSVYLGIDGLPYDAVREAQARGAFSGSAWNLSRFVTNFPGTSDASWTRIMHAEPMHGYEFQYFDVEKDEMINDGLLGLGLHILPPITGGIVKNAYKGFNFIGDGYLSTAHSYQSTRKAFAGNLDQIFYLLGGRAETASAFSAYMLEIDALGHMASREQVVTTIVQLSNRIDEFRKAHPERKFNFTLFSDHGNDFIRVPRDKLVSWPPLMEKAGVELVKSLKDTDPSRVAAVPVVHTRVTYLALHTHEAQAEEVARRLSTSAPVDLALARCVAPDDTSDVPAGARWFGYFEAGQRTQRFAYDPQGDRYYLPVGDYSRLGLDPALTAGAAGTIKRFSDEELFKNTATGTYPDVFYRVRTALSPVGVLMPAQVFLSLKHPYVTKGFEPPAGEDIAVAGFHGALDSQGSSGTLISTEKSLPAAVRADTFLELFPRMRRHMESRGARIHAGDSGESLDYEAMK